MIYRILVSARIYFEDEQGRRISVSSARLMGAGRGGCRGMMDLVQLPRKLHPRARFFFTEKSWRAFGRFIYREARNDGRAVKLVKKRNPARSQITYQDEYQVAILPIKCRYPATRAVALIVERRAR